MERNRIIPRLESQAILISLSDELKLARKSLDMRILAGKAMSAKHLLIILGGS